MIEEATRELVNKRDLSRKAMESVMEEIMGGKTDTAEIVSFLTALSSKVETAEEITAAVSVMRKYALKVSVKQDVVLDTCGTGADNLGTFNVSTAVAFVAAGSGITVAKHGNRSVSSRCGSADILEALGININLSKEKLELCLVETGIAFLFAPNFHPAMKYAMAARKQINARTIFNILGPLSNPAGATHQLVGVFNKSLTFLLAQVLANLGAKHALVVHGEDGLDEISTTAKTFVSEVNRGKLSSYEITPEQFGFKRAKMEDLKGGGAQENAVILLDVLKGKQNSYRDIVLLNAGASIYAADKTSSIREGIVLAAQSIDTQAAFKKVEQLKNFSKS